MKELASGWHHFWVVFRFPVGRFVGFLLAVRLFEVVADLIKALALFIWKNL